MTTADWEMAACARQSRFQQARAAQVLVLLLLEGTELYSSLVFGPRLGKTGVTRPVCLGNPDVHLLQRSTRRSPIQLISSCFRTRWRTFWRKSQKTKRWLCPCG